MLSHSQPMTSIERDCLEYIAYFLARGTPRDQLHWIAACRFIMGLEGRPPLNNDYRNEIVWC